MKTVQHVAVITLAALCLIFPAEAARYRLTDLGRGSAHGINDDGQVVGANTAGAFFWTGTGGFQNLGLLPGMTSGIGFGINHAGQVTGYNVGDSGVPRAFLWTSTSGLQEVPGLGEGQDINNDGDIVGNIYPPTTGRRAALWSSTGGLQDLGVLPGHTYSNGSAINSSQEVVGDSSTNNDQRAFLWTGTGGMQELPVLPGTARSRAEGINDVGQIVGTSYSPGNRRAVLWTTTGAIVDLGDLPGGDDYEAYGINDAGDVVGLSSGGSGDAFIWSSAEGMQNLNTMLDASGMGWRLVYARAINNAGQIVAAGNSPTECCHAFVLTPIPGDFNLDGQWDCADVNSLVGVIAAGTNDPAFDLTGDGNVDTSDLTQWLANAGGINLASGNAFLPGDANLNGDVDGSDFGIWNANKFTSVAAWCSGDFNANGVVDGSDFGIWNANKFTSALATSVVPEPVGVPLILIAAGCMFASRRYRSATM